MNASLIWAPPVGVWAPPVGVWAPPVGVWAEPAGASGPSSRATMARPSRIRVLMSVSSLGLVRERPQAQLFLGDLPQPGEAVRLHDQEEDDERAEDHQLDLLLQR